MTTTLYMRRADRHADSLVWTVRGLARLGGMHPIIATVDHGTAELRPDPRHDGGWTLLVDGVEQSYVREGDPRELRYPYVRRLAAVISTAAPAGNPVRALHLGAGALTLPRLVESLRPGSEQVVVEHDRALVELVTRVLPLPEASGIRLHIGDARAHVETSRQRFDVVVADVYRGASMPVSVASVEFAEHVAALLDSERALYAVNVTDLPPLTLSRIQAATLRAAFADVCLIAEPAMLRGRRYGNVVLAAAGELDVVALRRLVADDSVRASVLHGDVLTRFIAGTGAMRDAAP